MYVHRIYDYVGAPVLTRGEYGVNVSGGHTRPDDPESVYVTDPDFGDLRWCSAAEAEANGFSCSLVAEDQWWRHPAPEDQAPAECHCPRCQCADMDYLLWDESGDQLTCEICHLTFTPH